MNSSETKLTVIRGVLGTPHYEDDDCLIYNMDCAVGLRLLHECGSILDATITSPPYNIGKEYERIMPVDEFIAWLEGIAKDLYAATKPDGTFLLNVGYLQVPGKGRAIPIPYLLWDRMRFFLHQEIVWNYGAGVAARHYLSPRNEKVLWYVKNPDSFTFNLDSIRDPDVKYPNQKKNGKLRCNTLGKNPSDVWQIAKVTSGTNRSSAERTEHPAQFPIDLINRLILGFTNQNDVILDPFMGSGTTAESALRNGRKVIGFELSAAYCDVIATRLTNLAIEKRNQANSPMLFTEPYFAS